MVVMVVMALIASAIAVSVLHAYEVARGHTTETTARTLQSATVQYLLEHPDAECPSAEELASSDVVDATRSANDAWGTPFTIECDDRLVHVRSAGRDRQLGTDDDIAF
jgi:type II secretory pathway pseudopilin PulG